MVVALTLCIPLPGAVFSQDSAPNAGGTEEVEDEGTREAFLLPASGETGSEVPLAVLPAVSAAGFDAPVIERARSGDASQRLQLLGTYEELFNWPMTEALAEMVLEQDGADSIPALQAKTNASLQLKKGDAAMHAASRLVELDPSPDNQALRATALTALGRHREAALALAALKAEAGQTSPFRWQEDLAFAWFHAGEQAKASRAFDEILTGEGYPAAARATARRQLRLARALEAQQWMRDGEHAKAVAALETLKKAGGSPFEFQEDLGFAYQHAGRLSESRRTFEEIISEAGHSRLAKSNAREQINLIDSIEAEQLKEQGDYESALKLLNQLKGRFGSGIFPFQDQLAYTLSDSGDLAAAREAFQVIVDNKGYPADQRRKAAEEIEEIAVTGLLNDGYAALEGRIDWRKARRIDAELMSRHATHPDAIGFHASILSLSGRCKEAVGILEQLRAERFAGQPFPLAGTLAECYYQIGRMEEARQAYRDAFELSSIEPAEQVALQDSYREFRRESRTTVSTSLTGRSEEDGDTLTSEVEVRVPFGAGWALGAEFQRVDSDGSESQTAMAMAEKGWGAGYYVQAKAGTNEDSAAYAATVGKRKRALGRTAWSATYAENETAEDTTELIAGDGRQDRASIEVQHDITPALRITAGADWRSVETTSQDLGDGFDLHFEAAYGWNVARGRQRTFELAYVADASRFDDAQSRINNSVFAMVDKGGELIDTDYHRQGTEARWFGSYGRLEPFAMAGTYYRIDEGALEYEFGMGIDFTIDPDTNVFLRGQYLSSGEGRNSGSAVLEGQVGLEKSF